MKRVVVGLGLAMLLATPVLARPAWVDKPAIEGKLCAVGQATSRKPDVAQRLAADRARAKLLERIQTDLGRAVKKTYSRSVKMLTKKMKKIKYVEKITEVSVKGILHGSTVERSFADPDQGATQVLVCMTAESVRASAIENLARHARETALFKKGKTDAALAILNRAVEKAVR